MGLAIGIHASFETRQTEEHGAINGIIEGAPHQGVGASVAEGYPPSKGNVDPDATDDGVDEDGLAEPWRSPDAQRKTGALAIPRKGARLVGLSVAVLGGFGLGYLVGLWGTNRA
jgi:hypothetical protein